MKNIYKIISLVFISVSSITFGMNQRYSKPINIAKPYSKPINQKPVDNFYLPVNSNFFLPEDLMFELEMEQKSPVKQIKTVSPVVKKISPVLSPVKEAKVIHALEIKESQKIKENQKFDINNLSQRKPELCVSPRFSLKNKSIGKTLMLEYQTNEIKHAPVMIAKSPVHTQKVVIPSLEIKKEVIEDFSRPLSPYRGLVSMLEIFKHRKMITEQEYTILLEKAYNGVTLFHYLDQKLVFKKLDIYNEIKYWAMVQTRMNSLLEKDTNDSNNVYIPISPLSKQSFSFYQGQEIKVILVVKSFLLDMNKNVQDIEEVIQKITPRAKYTPSGFLDYCFLFNDLKDSSLEEKESPLKQMISQDKKQEREYNKIADCVQKVIFYLDGNNKLDEDALIYFAEKENLLHFIQDVIVKKQCKSFENYWECIEQLECGNTNHSNKLRLEFYYYAVDTILYEFMQKQPVYSYKKELEIIMAAITLLIPVLDKQVDKYFTNLSNVKKFVAYVMNAQVLKLFETYWIEYECDVTLLPIHDYELYEKRKDEICSLLNDFCKQ